MTIILYDIPSTHPGNAWSPSTFKTRYSLNFKGLSFTTEWVEYPDIEPHCKKLGINATSKSEDGRDLYTLPAIHDPSTGIYIADSLLIAKYLDETYPDTPAIFPRNTAGLHHAFTEAFEESIDPLWAFILPQSCWTLNPRSSEYFRRTREAAFGTTMEDLVPKGDQAVEQWSKLQAAFSKVSASYAITDDKGPYMMGQNVSWTDLLLCALFSWMKIVWGKDDQKWKDVVEWDGGRWGRLLQDFERYAV